MKNLCFVFLIFLLFAPTGYGQKNPTTVESKPARLTVKESPPDSRVRIFDKPRAAYPQSDNGTVCMQGTVRLKVEFLATGEIGKIVPITRLPYGATENAIEAARLIEFIPAKRVGKPITTTSTVEYSFSIY